MSDTKYVILKEVKTQYGSVSLVPIIFPDCITHELVADHFGGKENVESAGFMSMGMAEEDSDDLREYSAWGESVSLGVESKDDDARLIRRVFEPY
jgi:hypothetical protein